MAQFLADLIQGERFLKKIISSGVQKLPGRPILAVAGANDHLGLGATFPDIGVDSRAIHIGQNNIQ